MTTFLHAETTIGPWLAYCVAEEVGLDSNAMGRLLSCRKGRNLSDPFLKAVVVFVSGALDKAVREELEGDLKQIGPCVAKVERLVYYYLSQAVLEGEHFCEG